jgi:hypothetical protein
MRFSANERRKLRGEGHSSSRYIFMSWTKIKSIIVHEGKNTRNRWNRIIFVFPENLGRNKLIMSIPSEVKNLNAKCADTAFFFYLGWQKNVNAEKWKENWWAGKSIYTSSPLFKDEYPICIPIWIMFSSLYTRFSVRVNLVYDTNGSGDCKYYYTRFL